MKKTIPTSIGNTLFYIEEDTFKELEQYLSSIREHFSTSKDAIEIVHDIEDRIRERFVEFTGADSKTERIITKNHVDELIKQMGRPEDFGDDISDNTNRKLYRDSENRIIGGVASGIATYFDIDPTIVRVLFLISFFLGGAGVIAYIIIWIVVPEAKTTSQKLEMHGNPVNLHSMSEKVKEKIETVSKKINNNENLEKARNRFGNFFTKSGSKFVQVLGKIIGISLKIVSGFAIIGIVSAFVIGIFNPITSLVGITVIGMAIFPLYYFLLTTIFFLVLIPFIFIYALGTIIMGRKTFFRGLAGSILAGLWAVALIATIVTIGTSVNKLHGTTIRGNSNWGNSRMIHFEGNGRNSDIYFRSY